MSDETVLAITGPGIAPYSARGLTQSLTPIEAALSMRRTINGALLDLSASQFRKYKSSISGSDQAPPAFDGLWPGAAVTVDCAVELGYKAAGGSPERPMVPGSLRTEGEYTYYRPRLLMRIVTPANSLDEWAAGNQWTLDLEEV